MIRGEVWWTDVPGMGRRPALILSRDPAIPWLPSLAIAIFSRTIREIPSEVVVEETEGMPARSAVNLQNLFTVSKARLRTRITTLSDARMDEVCEALRYAVAC